MLRSVKSALIVSLFCVVVTWFFLDQRVFAKTEPTPDDQLRQYFSQQTFDIARIEKIFGQNFELSDTFSIVGYEGLNTNHTKESGLAKFLEQF